MKPKLPDSLALYLVTGRDLLPSGVDYYEHLDQTLKAGAVTMVQIREKHVDNAEFLEIATKSLAICDKYSVPMLVNDNLAVALCLPDRVGLHIGQDDVPLREARRLMGPNRLIGISVHNEEEARQAGSEGLADYAGIGAVYGTQSKAGVTEDKVLGRVRAGQIGTLLAEAANGPFPFVLIGGIKAANAAQTLIAASDPKGPASGIAVISAIVARRDPDAAARELATLVNSHFQLLKAYGPTYQGSSASGLGVATLRDILSKLMAHHRTSVNGPPLVQTLTSHVSANTSANVALAFSSSPIMSQEAAEADDIGLVNGAVVLNIGTISEAARAGMKAVGAAANRNMKPVVLDPVGVGASAFRKRCVKEILDHTQVTLIKGNAAEIAALAGSTEVASRGVDSGAGLLKNPVETANLVARQHKCMVLLTGKSDYLTDGDTTVVSSNGHPYLGQITASGCSLGVMVAAGMAAACASSKAIAADKWARDWSTKLVNGCSQQIFAGALLGLLSMNIAADIAAERPDVHGPGTFLPALIDEIARLDSETLGKRAKLSVSSSE